MPTISCRDRNPFGTTDWYIRHLRGAFTTPDGNADGRYEEMPPVINRDVGTHCGIHDVRYLLEILSLNRKIFETLLLHSHGLY